MSRARRLLPLVTTALPVFAGTVPFLHGAFAGVVAVAGPLVVDLVLEVRGGTRWRAGDVEPPLARRYFSVLFTLYAVGYALFFSRFVLTSATLPLADLAGHVFSWAVLSGVPTLIVGHALIHARSRLARGAGQVLFSLMGYPDFPRLHVEVHHRHVATDADHHSARAGETFYGFFARSLLGELTSLPKPGQRRTATLLLGAQVLLVAAVGLVAGPRALAAFASTALLARGVVALVNYVQHYGLERAPREKVGVDHAWDLPFKSGNWLYFNAGFHADHHMKASTDPAALVYRSTRYILPYNVSIILPLALVPPLFFRAMDPLLAAPAAHRRMGACRRSSTLPVTRH